MTTPEEFWSKAAPRYAKMPVRNIDAYKRTLARTRNYLSPGDHALEVGCGTGGTARELAPNLGHITATDIAPEMIRIAQERARDEGVTNATFVAADIADSPAGPFDVVLAHNLLHLVPDTQAALADLRDRLKPGGVFISKTVCLGQPGLNWKIRLVLKALPLLQWLGKAPRLQRLSGAEIEAMITDAGFEVLEAVTDPETSRYIVARKT
ncbi:class I SAM-dependent methyltransferase [Lutimaribacter sp. EGI FJ00015]|uniref:Class I SAM-dependent methyltransferase n=1 Tax=Lutimaribacter degradans TaxID=2945989 RepID=A0ACC5ZV13_9RHOB|nr:class I SAM-dependent methyltransferase [Lutimaribacter sp. EGI FJ00013]MCM2562189.1 class I SAM-dependent methyltransferase [Lutimaribacter sp. EGI FJ00013]MCO0613343.1 class I SAM-dependent methyltransferase [Lutimaribacter sp. EGI FJ00015]MCO0636318.1 class I SAM-dependent methyltransferase [Lutimaribacter sp. EGI FJ00014]